MDCEKSEWRIERGTEREVEARVLHDTQPKCSEIERYD